MKSTKSKIIIVMCAVLCIMAVGYAAFSTVLTITGTANIASEWKVVFTKIEQVSKTSGVNIKSTPVASGTTATFNVGLTSPGDKIVYKITLANQGTIDAVIKNIQASATDSPAIIFTVEGVNIGDELKNKTSKDFTVTIEYDPHVTSQPDKLQKTLTVSIVTEQYVNQSIDSSTPNVNQPTYLRSEILKNNIAQADINIDFSQTSSDTNGKGLYVTSTNTEGNLPTYYFRGAVDNNYVKFGKYSIDNIGYRGYESSSSTSFREYKTIEQCNNASDYNYNCKEYIYANKGDDMFWKIVRINEDGSIRMIYSGTSSSVTGDDAAIGKSMFNTEANDNAYVGYMYGTPGSDTYEATHANTNNSTIKTYIDNWYNSNLSSYSSYLADAGFCNDRSISSGLGYGTNNTTYPSFKRLYKDHTPQFACPNANNDLFTTSTSTKGNRALIYPIGLITADEVWYAGATYLHNQTYYLYTAAYYWTMTPVDPDLNLNGLVRVRDVYADGSTYPYRVDDDDGVRPVINLKSTVELSTDLPEGCTKQNGTASCPYIINTN